MQTYKTSLSIRHVGMASVVFAVLGGVFFWWTPLGMVLSLTGLLMGFIAWTMSRPNGGGYGVAVAGMVLSLASLILDSVIAGLGLELIKFHALR